MRQQLLITTAGAALVAGTVFAAAQGMQRQSPGGEMDKGAPPQGQMQQQPKGQQSQPPGQRKGPKEQTQGQGQREQGEAPKQQQKSQTQGQGQREQGQAPKQQQQKDQTQGQGQREQGPAPKQQMQKQDQQPQQGQQPKGQQQQGAQQGQTGGVTLTVEQRTRIRETVLRGSGGPRVTNVNFQINVGTVVPRSVRAVAVPQLIVEIHPAWRGYLYFIVGERIIIVEPDTYRIVAILVV